MELSDWIGAVAVPIAIFAAGWVMKLQSTLSNVVTRLDANESDNKTLHTRVNKRDDEIACLDRKVDELKVEMKVELAEIKTKLDMLLKDK